MYHAIEMKKDCEVSHSKKAMGGFAVTHSAGEEVPAGFHNIANLKNPQLVGAHNGSINCLVSKVSSHAVNTGTLHRTELKFQPVGASTHLRFKS